jgi:hypothetical protein
LKIDAALAPAFTPWLAQQFCVPVIAIFCLAGTASVPQSFSPGTAPPAAIENAWGMIVACSVGFLLAFLINHISPKMAEDGRLIWVLPSILLTMSNFSELFHQDLPHVLRECFFPRPDENLFFGFATLPTYSCIAYSIGVVFARRIKMRKLGTAGSVG